MGCRRHRQRAMCDVGNVLESEAFGSSWPYCRRIMCELRMLDVMSSDDADGEHNVWTFFFL